MVLDKMKSKDILFLFILVVSTQQTHSYNCLWDYIYDAVYEETDKSENDMQPILATTQSPQLPEKVTDMEDDVSSEPHLSVWSKYGSPPPDEATSFFSFDFDLIRTTSTDAKDEIYGVPPLGYLVALAIGVACLLVVLVFCRKFQILRKKIEKLEGRFSDRAEESLLGADELEELMKEKQEDLEKTALLSSNWSTEKIFYFLKHLATDVVEESDGDDEKVNYLTDDFLQKISKYIESQESLRKDVEILTPESLLRLGKFYHRHFSRSQEAGEREVKVNVGVYVNGVATQDRS